MTESKQMGPGMESRALADRLGAVETENVTWLGPGFPLFWDSADGVWVQDADGQTYLDMTAAFGVSALGHGAAAVRKALHEQVDTLIHGMGDVHPPTRKVELLEKLAAISPIENPRITLGTSGTMATEIALKAAQLHTGKAGLLSFKGAYHGLSAGSLRVIGHSKFHAPFDSSLGPRALEVDFPLASKQGSGERALESVREALVEGRIGAVIIEPIQGRGGIHIPPPGFLRKLKEVCAEHDALLILDEIFTGLYRTGPAFACMEDRVTPDLLLVGKALGGGMPIGACVGSKAVMDSFGPSPGEATHTETFLGHPLTMASAMAVLDVLEEGWIKTAVQDRGTQLESILTACFKALSGSVASIRGRGLMWGVELSDPSLCKEVVGAALSEGLILLGGGLHGNVVQFTPPLSIKQEELDDFGQRLEHALRAVARKRH